MKKGSNGVFQTFLFATAQVKVWLTMEGWVMLKARLFAAACRAIFVLGAAVAVAAPPVVASAAVQDPVSQLAAQIQQAIVTAQAEASAAGLSQDDATAVIEAAIQAVIAMSGQSPAVASQALASARASLATSGQLSLAAAAAVTSVQTIVTAANTAGGAPAAGGGQTGGPPLGAPGSAGGGGGGGSDYRPVT
mgnify:CR=1 FL=1